jgi:glycosyltransferase involved in cell wall biosynthesis
MRTGRTGSTQKAMAKPLVSIHMCTYNHAPLIGQAIEGVLRQKTNFPFELVVGEDCSTDGTRETVLAYQKKHPDIIRVITSGSNVGMKENNVRTRKACRGKYIAFCEGDDHWHDPYKLQKQAGYLESHPECGLVHSSYDVHLLGPGIRIPDYIHYKKWTVPENPRVADFVAKREMSHVILTCTVMIRRSLCEQIIEADPYLHQSGFFRMGDTQLWAEIAARARTHYIPESLATYTITEESASRSRDIRKTLRFFISIADLFIYLGTKYGVSPDLIAEHRANRIEYSLRLAFHTRDAGLAEEVRNQKQTFTPKEWIRYYGAKNAAVHFLYRTATSFKNVFRSRRNPWM